MGKTNSNEFWDEHQILIWDEHLGHTYGKATYRCGCGAPNKKSVTVFDRKQVLKAFTKHMDFQQIVFKLCYNALISFC